MMKIVKFMLSILLCSIGHSILLSELSMSILVIELEAHLITNYKYKWI